MGLLALGNRLLLRRLQPLPRLRPQLRRLIRVRVRRLTHPGRAEEQVGLAGQLRVLSLRVEDVLGQLRRLLRVAVAVVEQPPRSARSRLSGEAASPHASSGRSSDRGDQGADAQHEDGRLPQAPQ